MWQGNWRDEIWRNLGQPWDVLVIGGGITGAGVFNMAARCGLRVLLVEASDFSFGTSSRSSKLVHGGMRYLRNRQFKVTQESVHERERMLRQAPRLVTPLRFLLPAYSTYRTSARALGLGVLIYDLLAPKWAHHRYSPAALETACPLLNQQDLLEAHDYYDAAVDDSRLVLRVIQEGERLGGTALNYSAAISLLRGRDGQVRGAVIEDRGPDGAGRTAEVQASVVINATGPFSDELRREVGGQPHIRPLRGSHLVFPRSRIPLDCAVNLMHPGDGRAMFVIPWEGATMIGTTDLDHHPAPGEREPAASSLEVEYMLEAGNFLFPSLHLSESDILSSFAGLRPIVNGNAENPSKESRRHVVWEEDGLLTITGGKLTIFRVMAADVLKEAARSGRVKPNRPFHWSVPAFDRLPQLPDMPELESEGWLYLAGRYGAETGRLLGSAQPWELERIGQLPNRWAELRWAARCEGVQHLDDLLLRRVRLGLLLPEGGLKEIERIRAVAQGELGWSDERWQSEVQRYAEIWRKSYYLPESGGGLAVDWNLSSRFSQT